jgi:hypothetical protein
MVDPVTVRTLSINEALDKMRMTTTKGAIIYKMVQNKRSVISPAEMVYMEFVQPPHSFNNEYNGRPMMNYSMRVNILEFDPKTNSWIRDDKETAVYLTEADYNFLTNYVKPTPTTIVSVSGKSYQDKMGNWVIGRTWRLIPRISDTGVQMNVGNRFEKVMPSQPPKSDAREEFMGF